MKTTIKSLDHFKALSVMQFDYEPLNVMKILNGDDAINTDKVEVSEIDTSGRVSHILAINKTDEFVFFADGDILRGAKQNRTLNTSILMYPNKKVVIPVSCVEAGRWRFNSDKFKPEEFSKPIEMRKKMNQQVTKNKLSNPSSYDANQGLVWDTVSQYSISYNLKSSTSSYSDLIENNKNNFKEFGNKFKYTENSTGFAFYKNNKLISIEALNNQELAKHHFSKLINGIIPDVYQIERIENFDEKKCTDSFNYFIKSYLDEPYKLYPGVDAGTEKRFDSEILTGFELTYENKLIHLSILNLN
ncbi:MAG TPA: hypothetical protein DEP28_07420 [Bacteroidetes bacterium]|nr:hypothetical protein [Bacteroidota bacterium]